MLRVFLDHFDHTNQSFVLKGIPGTKSFLKIDSDHIFLFEELELCIKTQRSISISRSLCFVLVFQLIIVYKKASYFAKASLSVLGLCFIQSESIEYV